MPNPHPSYKQDPDIFTNIFIRKRVSKWAATDLAKILYRDVDPKCMDPEF